MVDWTDFLEGKLRHLWEQTDPRLSTKEISRQMEVSKNAVCGKADRMGLEPRGSPIRRYRGAPRQIQRAGITTLEPMASAPDPAAAVVRPARTPTTCCFPFGDPGTRSFRFCEETALPGKPYCQDCCKRVYARPADDR